ncbi:iron donor protein CyaY [Magnetospirillum sp. UT-4]|uniref:iron donor protein CyaY n=1 Tax=Magnetospirillum sp. UT-4 TaxID=2681467 RepID=UPI00137F4FCD|nr:iron donor protein CyaY [Magnetospirillum sp. UT-4]CAA7625603.1 Protein CyaY [Magnetospirillum sp. UT-4]
MSLDDSRFNTLADDLIEGLADAIDEALGDRLDADLHGAVLTITIKGGGQYVVNKNGPMKQVWLSSPVSGAWHFDYADGDWISTRAPKVTLDSVLAGELEATFGVRVEF